MLPIKKILVPIDFTETSAHALDYAVDLEVVVGAAVSVRSCLSASCLQLAGRSLVAPRSWPRRFPTRPTAGR